MKRTFVILVAVLLLASSFLVALAVAPAQVERAWRGAGLPPNAIRKLAALLPGQGVTGLPEPTGESVALRASGTLEAEAAAREMKAFADAAPERQSDAE